MYFFFSTISLYQVGIYLYGKREIPCSQTIIYLMVFAFGSTIINVCQKNCCKQIYRYWPERLRLPVSATMCVSFTLTNDPFSGFS